MGKPAALDVAGNIEAGDLVAVGIEGVAVFVRLQAAADDEQQRAFKLVGIVWAILQRPQAACDLTEIIVRALFRKLVVARNGLKGSFLGLLVVGVHFGDQLLQRVGLDGAPVSHRGFQLIGALVVAIGLVVLWTVVGTGIILNIAGTAVSSGHVRELFGPVAVEDLPGFAALLQLDLVFDLLAGQVLVHEAFAVHVEIQKARISHHADACEIRAATHVVDHRRVVLLHLGTCPHAEFDAVAGVGFLAFYVHIDEETHDAVFNDIGAEVFDHGVILGIVVRR